MDQTQRCKGDLFQQRLSCLQQLIPARKQMLLSQWLQTTAVLMMQVVVLVAEPVAVMMLKAVEANGKKSNN